MTERMWITSHVHQLVEDVLGVCRVETDDDGDVGFRAGTAACWVSVLACESPMVRVFAHAALGLRPTAKLLRELNEIQRGAVSARVEWANGIAIVSQTVSPIGLTAPVLEQAMQSVSLLAGDIGGLLAAAFDGHTPFAPEVEVNTGEDAA